jgi:hypothetical protein
MNHLKSKVTLNQQEIFLKTYQLLATSLVKILNPKVVTKAQVKLSKVTKVPNSLLILKLT